MNRTARQLIVSADDFGADMAVNEAVEQAFTHGILTSASLMMGGAAAADAVGRAHRLKGLAVGLHVTLADGTPVSPASRVPGLIDGTGRFRNDLFRSGLRWFMNPAVRAQLIAEIKAQFSAFASTGLILDHVDAHKHLHLHPTVGALIIKIGERYGMRAIRIPDEPKKIVSLAEPGIDAPRPPPQTMLRLLRRRARRAGLIVNDHVFGLAWSGAMTEDRILSLIPHLPGGINELYTHPATRAAETMPHAAPGYRYRDELGALMSERVRDAIAANDITVTSYSALALKRVHREAPA